MIKYGVLGRRAKKENVMKRVGKSRVVLCARTWKCFVVRTRVENAVVVYAACSNRVQIYRRKLTGLKFGL